MTMLEAVKACEAGHVQRVAMPGKWKVWRNPDGSVEFEVLS